MLIIDLSQIATASLMVQTQAWKPGARVDINVDLVRGLVLNSIRMNLVNHRKKPEDIIIACDTGVSWRKAAFPYYKGKRSKSRTEMKIDWKTYFAFLDILIQDLKDHFPYIVIDVPHAEGDDVIGTLVRWYQENALFEEIMIISGDKDFKQLHDDRTRQFSPILRKFIGTSDVALEKKQHIIKGDRDDGVPNILSADGSFVLDIRQQKMSAKRLEYYTQTDPADYEPTVQRNWHRNKLMIDLDETPQRLKDQIMASFHQQRDNPNKNGVFNYLFKHSLAELQGQAGDF